MVVDQYGRQSLFSTYVQFQCKIPHPFSAKRRITSSRSNDDELLSSGAADTYSLYDNVSLGGRSLGKKGKLINVF